MNASPTERYFFVHLQKTGGTTLVHRLPRRFRPAEIYPNDSDGDRFRTTISVDHLLHRWRTHAREVRIVAGHFPLCTAELLGADFRTLTVLREPVERTLSYLRHHRELTPGDHEKPLEMIYDDPFRFDGLVHNHMVKMLSLTTTEMTNGALTHVDFDRARLETAKRALATIDVVGFQERFEQFWSDLSRRFEWALGEPEYTNQTAPVEVSEEFRARIALDNALDVELYEHALLTYTQPLEGGQPASVH